jgi:BASS family bile acid:Na+ symporter
MIMQPHPDTILGFTVAGWVLGAIYLVSMMFSVGLGMREAALPEEKEKRSKRIRRLFVGLVFNLVVFPGLALLLTRSFHLSSDVAFALLIVAASPGGRFAPHLARMAGGSMGMATEETLLLAKVSVFTVPVTTNLLLGVHHLHLRELPLILQIVLLQVVPLYAGKALARWRGETARRIDRPLRIVATVAAVGALATFLFQTRFRGLAMIGDRGWLALLVLAAASVGLGWLLGGASTPARRTLTISVLSRNLALALLVAGMAFPGRNVQLAVFGVWATLAVIAYLFTELVAHRPLRTPMRAT